MVIYVQAAADARARAFRLSIRSFLPSPSSYLYNVLCAYEKRCHFGFKMFFNRRIFCKRISKFAVSQKGCWTSLFDFDRVMTRMPPGDPPGLQSSEVSTSIVYHTFFYFCRTLHHEQGSDTSWVVKMVWHNVLPCVMLHYCNLMSPSKQKRV